FYNLLMLYYICLLFFFFQAEDGIRDRNVTGVQTCALPILPPIQLPAMVVRPRHSSSAPVPATISGATIEKIHSTNGPPIIIPTVPAKNMIIALGPSRS